MKRSCHVMSEGWAPALSFGKAFHKGEPLLASLLNHQTSLKSHYPPRDMEEILFCGEELIEEFGNKTKGKEMVCCCSLFCFPQMREYKEEN